MLAWDSRATVYGQLGVVAGFVVLLVLALHRPMACLLDGSAGRVSPGTFRLSHLRSERVAFVQVMSWSDLLELQRQRHRTSTGKPLYLGRRAWRRHTGRFAIVLGEEPGPFWQATAWLRDRAKLVDAAAALQHALGLEGAANAELAALPTVEINEGSERRRLRLLLVGELAFVGFLAPSWPCRCGC